MRETEGITIYENDVMEDGFVHTRLVSTIDHLPLLRCKNGQFEQDMSRSSISEGVRRWWMAQRLESPNLSPATEHLENVHLN